MNLYIIDAPEAQRDPEFSMVHLVWAWDATQAARLWREAYELDPRAAADVRRVPLHPPVQPCAIDWTDITREEG